MYCALLLVVSWTVASISHIGHHSPRQAWYCGISWKPLKIAAPLLSNKLSGFRRGCILENFRLMKFKMAADWPLFTSTGLILLNIMKTAQDSYTITIKQIVRFQGRKHFEKNWLDQVQNGRLFGHYSFSHGRYLVNRARLLDHYYKTKCEFSGENASWKI